MPSQYDSAAVWLIGWLPMEKHFPETEMYPAEQINEATVLYCVEKK